MLHPAENFFRFVDMHKYVLIFCANLLFFQKRTGFEKKDSILQKFML